MLVYVSLVGHPGNVPSQLLQIILRSEETANKFLLREENLLGVGL